jgi:hypothetical protein
MLLLRMQKKDISYSQFDKLGIALNDIGLNDAKEKAEASLLDKCKFECIEATGAFPHLICNTNQHVFAIFSKYRSIRVLNTQAILGWEEVRVSNLNSEFIRIGSRVDAAELSINTRDGDDRVFIIDGTEENEQDIDSASFLSIYHWLLFVGTEGEK